MTEFWRQWEGAVLEGVFPLRRLLSASDHSAVFLTECKAQHLPNAAIKLIAADSVSAEAQLSLWKTAAALSHPHLIRLFDTGRCQLGGQAFLFVVMEYAEQTLAQILPQRALTPDEVREMLIPTLDALAFLHGKNLVQGQLKPPNVLVVNDQLKLASDTIRPAGKSTAKNARFSLYDPPEARSGASSAAADIWGLGITTVEALTQHPPAWRNERACLPAALPAEFAEVLERCLSTNPAQRPTSTDLVAFLLQRPPAAAVVSAPQASARETPPRAAAPHTAPKRRALLPAVALVLLVLLVGWASLRFFQGRADSRQSASNNSQVPSQQAGTAAATASQNAEHAPPESSAPSSSAKSARSKPALARAVASPLAKSAQPSADASAAVIHEEIPAVPRSARETIHGNLRVTVLVNVDRSGNVTEAILRNPGPSGYFARLAKEAAGKWKFVPANDEDPRKWVLTFEFTRGGTTATVTAPRL
jgi:TonB family protein